MDKILEIKKYRIPKVKMDFEKISEGEHLINIETSINIMIPKDVTDKICIVVIKTQFKNESQEEILSVLIRSFVEIKDVNISNEDKEKSIRLNAVPIIYEKLREFIEQLLETAQINSMNIPPYMEMDI